MWGLDVVGGRPLARWLRFEGSLSERQGFCARRSHKQVRARVEHVFASMKTWKILRDCRLKGDGVHHAMLGIARLHNLALAG